ncbi:hypothetical protein CSW10_02650 [Mesomycoplasma dispar]|uniref:DUF31 domain-containing protein n=1 Tax=Mesomycoplasma dispar TaxID=86660 RepID=A0ABM6PRM9_9BACT|nr:hypothetical protein CSW10_02650 [Mesomycoplasma dispar]
MLVSLFSSSLILSPFFLLTANNKTYQNFSEKNIIKQQNPEIINFNFHENDILVGFNKKVHNLHLNKIFDNQKSEIITKVSDAFSIKTEVKKKTKIKPGFLKPGPIQWNYKSDPKKPGYNYIYERIVNPGKYWNRITGNPAQIVQNVRIGYWNLANFTQQTNFNSIAKTILDTKSSIMALSENFGGGSNLDSSKILENLNLDSKNSETEWVQVSSKNGKNQENETKKYSFFYKKNELTLSGNHISKPDSNPFLVSDQQINNTFPVALGFKALNNNKEFLVIMGDFAQKIQEKAQEPEEQTDQNRKNSKENDSETNKERIYHPFLFSDEEKPVIKQE